MQLLSDNKCVGNGTGKKKKINALKPSDIKEISGLKDILKDNMIECLNKPKVYLASRNLTALTEIGKKKKK